MDPDLHPDVMIGTRYIPAFPSLTARMSSMLSAKATMTTTSLTTTTAMTREQKGPLPSTSLS